MNQITFRIAATINNPYDLFGSLLSPRNSLEFHIKKNRGGITTATAREEKRNVDRTVSTGKGERTVGTPEMSSPIDAGIKRPHPVANVATPLFRIRSSL